MNSGHSNQKRKDHQVISDETPFHSAYPYPEFGRKGLQIPENGKGDTMTSEGTGPGYVLNKT